jgi:hypothetical protein
MIFHVGRYQCANRFLPRWDLSVSTDRIVIIDIIAIFANDRPVFATAGRSLTSSSASASTASFWTTFALFAIGLFGNRSHLVVHGQKLIAIQHRFVIVNKFFVVQSCSKTGCLRLRWSVWPSIFTRSGISMG